MRARLRGSRKRDYRVRVIQRRGAIDKAENVRRNGEIAYNDDIDRCARLDFLDDRCATDKRRLNGDIRMRLLVHRDDLSELRLDVRWNEHDQWRAFGSDRGRKHGERDDSARKRGNKRFGK